MRKIHSFIILFIIGISCLSAQENEYHTNNKKAIKYFKQALKHAENRQDDLAVAAAKEACIEDTNFIEAFLFLSDIYEYNQQYDDMENVARKIARLDSENYSDFFLKAGRLAYENGNYQKAKQDILDFEEYAENYGNNQTYQNLKERIEFSIASTQNPVPFEPENLGMYVNTQYDDYWPSLTADGQILVTTILIPRTRETYEPGGGNFQEDLFQTFKNDEGQWFGRSSMGRLMNSSANEGAQCISSDGRLCVFTACNRPDGYGSCDLYISYSRGRQWSKPENLGPKVNTPFWESSPSLSADGKYLYYASSDTAGLGRSDIWRVAIEDGRVVGNPEWLKGGVNTETDELSPFIHPDGKTLYFASKGHVGLGNYDLFVSQLQNDGTWSKAKNLGYPINTCNEERSLIVDAGGKIAMFASERKEGYGGLDIYSFELPEELRPNIVTYVKGKVYDKETGKPLGAECKLYELSQGDLVANLKSDAVNGKYLVCLPEGYEYAFNVEHKGYMFYSENFSLKNLDENADAYILDIPLQPIKEGHSVVLKNIFFEFDDYKLKASSNTELKKLIQFMNDNPNISIEIGGHTDNIGSAEYNRKLSLNRSKSVYNYLTKNGINASRLSYKGYGFNVPLSDNDTEEGRALNRRTEFKIIKLKTE